MDWKPEEDIICCEVCVYEYVIKRNNTEIKSCIEKIKQHASIYQREDTSIRNRIQNVKATLDKWNVENTIPGAGLSNAAPKADKILRQCLENAGYCLKTSE